MTRGRYGPLDVGNFPEADRRHSILVSGGMRAHRRGAMDEGRQIETSPAEAHGLAHH